MKQKNFKWLMFGMIVLILVLAACGPSAPTKPTVSIVSINGQLVENQDLTVQVSASDSKGIVRIELSVDATVVSSADLQPVQSATVPLPWTATTGQHKVVARVFNKDSVMAESDAQLVGITPAKPGAPTVAPTQVPQPTAVVPTAVVPPVAPTTAAPTGVPCSTAFTFVADVTVPDGTTMTPNQAFNKTWRIRNSGTCAWTTAFQFARVAGEAMGAADAYAVPPTAPGANADVTIPFVAPAAPGTHQSKWQLRDASGVIAQPSFALVMITTVLPAPPAVSILSPGNGFNFAQGTTIKVTFQGFSNYTEMSSVSLYANGQLLNKVTSRTPSRQITGSYDWKPGVGNFDLYAVGVDVNNGMTTSAHVAGTISQPAPTCQLSVNYRADRTSITQGEHTTIRWDVDCANAVYLNDQGVTGHEARDIAPSGTTVYTLRSIRKDGSADIRNITINVGSAPVPPTPVPPSPSRRSINGLWVGGNYSLDLSEAMGCGNPCGAQGTFTENNGPILIRQVDVSGSFDTSSGSYSLVMQIPGGGSITVTINSNSTQITANIPGVGTVTMNKQ